MAQIHASGNSQESTIIRQKSINQYSLNIGSKCGTAKQVMCFGNNVQTGMVQATNPRSQTYIFESAIENNIAFLEIYFKAGGNINLFDNKRRTPLHHA